MSNETPRHCTECNAEIYESMGACNSADVMAFILGKQSHIRERCGLCALHPYRVENQKFDPYRKEQNHMNMESMFYRVISLNPYETYEMKVPCQTIWESPSYLAELAAKDFYQHHQEGWECEWPLTISIHWSRNGDVKGVSEVDRMMVPKFTAREAA